MKGGGTDTTMRDLETSWLRRLGVAWCSVVFCLGQVRGDEPAKTTYAEQVRPIFQEHCFACHSQDDKNSDLALDSYSAAMMGGAGGEILAAGDAGGSRLWRLVSHAEAPHMPPDSDKLPDNQLATIKSWIEGGLLENAGSKPKAKPALAPAAAPSVDNRPAGEPAMPDGLLCEPVVAPQRAAAVGALATSPWAPLVAIGAPRQVVLYHADSGALLGVLPYLDGTPHVVRFSRDGSLLLAAGGRPGAFGNAGLYDVKSGVRIATIGEEVDAVLAADLSQDQTLVAMGGPKKVVRVYHVSDGTVAYEIRKHTDWITAIAFSPDGKLLATADRAGGVFVWDASFGNEVAAVTGHAESVTAIAWRNDSQLIVTASEDDTIRMWDRSGKQLKSWAAHGGTLAIDFHRDGRIATTGRDRIVKLWDSEGNPVADLATLDDVGLSVRLTHDASAVVAGDWAGSVRVISVVDKEVRRTLAPNPQPGPVRVELAEARAVGARRVHEAATSALADARAKLAAASALIEAQREELAKAEAVVHSASEARRAAAKKLADATVVWQAAVEQASVHPSADAEAKVAAADEARRDADGQASSVLAAYRAAEGEAAARRAAPQAADLAPMQAAVASAEQAETRAAVIVVGVEGELALAIAQRDAYLHAAEKMAAAVSQLKAAAEESEAHVAAQLRERDDLAAALARQSAAIGDVAAKIAELERQRTALVEQTRPLEEAVRTAEEEFKKAENARSAAERAAALAEAEVADFSAAEQERAKQRER